MFEYIEKVLHSNIECSDYEKSEGLPLYITGAFDLFNLRIGNNKMLIAVPHADINLATLRKQQRRIEALTGMHCVLYEQPDILRKGQNDRRRNSFRLGEQAVIYSISWNGSFKYFKIRTAILCKNIISDEETIIYRNLSAME